MFDNKSTMKEIKDFLKKKGCKTSFKTKKDALAFIQRLSWVETFPWNEDQQVVLSWEKEKKFTEHVIQGTFGSGKSTMMLGIYLRILNRMELSPEEMLVCAFNISIKNELKKKIRELGFKAKPQVRTFDSMVYEICAHHQMKGLEKPDYEGRRQFVEKLIQGETGTTLFQGYNSIRLVLVDEVQDLDQSALAFFRAFFPNARFYYFGDVFQCIQKEPRCSLLWKLLKPELRRTIHFMKKTPRVPTPILEEIKKALTHHYPEFSKPISNWYSSNPIKNTSIQWIPIRHYSQIFEECKRFLEQYDPKDCMVLTFSSAITVKGNMGDLSRFRQFFLKEGIQVNRNYKSMDSEKLFLSTVNSSKGLERKHVFIALTFPLEMAFANFSNNLVVNLVSVGLSRCKETVRFCVPIYEDRFSQVLRLYPKCPTPDKEAGESVRKLKSSPKEEKGSVRDFLTRSHSATEIIRQSILSYSTRNHLRSHAKMMPPHFSFPAGNRIRWSMRNEEEASFMGILFEVLITSTWTKKWPSLDTSFISDVMSNPMYSHCRGGIHKQFQNLARSFRFPFPTCRKKFEVLFEYTQHHILLGQKIRVRISEDRKKEMEQVWNILERDIQQLCPQGNLKAQVNLNRSYMTGVADLICETEQEHIVYEIKTCTNSDWKENAFVQAALYCAMSKKLKSTIRLINPFRRELFEYKISLTPTEKNNTMQIVDRDLLIWNLNCFLAKCEIPCPSQIDFSNIVCLVEGTGVEWKAPTKTRHVLFSEEEYRSQGNLILTEKDFKSVICKKEGVDDKDWFTWILDSLHFEIKEKDWFDIKDSFIQVVLLCCFLRLHGLS